MDDDLYYNDSAKLELRKPDTGFNLTFHDDGEEVGRFWYEDDKLHFEGKATDASRIFTDFVIQLFEEWEHGR